MAAPGTIPLPDFGPSELGTKEYWDKVYDREVSNFQSHGDIGEIWFGEQSAMKMVDWVESHYEDFKETTSVLDLGCGNGHLLLDLAELDFTFRLVGIDYSPAAIKLAKAVAEDKEVADVIDYRAVDFLAERMQDGDEETKEWQAKNEKFTVVLDKGTYDAISLHQKNKRDELEKEKDVAVDKVTEQLEATKLTATTTTTSTTSTRTEEEPEDLSERYPSRVAAMMEDDGRLLITSCNWTQPELIARFAHVFDYDSHLRYPTFKFGGVQGQTISSVVFKKKTATA